MRHSLGNHQYIRVIDSASLRTSINDVVLLHVFSCLRGLVFVNPGWLVPVVVRDYTKFQLGVGHHADTPVKVGHAKNSISRFTRSVAE